MAGRDSVANMADFVARHGLEDVRQIADESGDVWSRFGIIGQPAWVFIDGETGERQTMLGALGGARLQQLIGELTG